MAARAAPCWTRTRPVAAPAMRPARARTGREVDYCKHAPPFTWLAVIFFPFEKTQEDTVQMEHPSEGEQRAGRHLPRRRLHLEEVRAEGHPRRQAPKVSASTPPVRPFEQSVRTAAMQCLCLAIELISKTILAEATTGARTGTCRAVWPPSRFNAQMATRCS